MLRLGARRRSANGGVARVDPRTKRLLTRVERGDVAVIDHEDLDRVAAEGLVAKGVAAVVNASPSISGRYPNLGPLVLVQAGVPLVDGVGPLLMEKVKEGAPLRVEGDRIYAGDQLVGVGTRQTESSVRDAMEAARAGLAEGDAVAVLCDAAPLRVRPQRLGLRERSIRPHGDGVERHSIGDLVLDELVHRASSPAWETTARGLPTRRREATRWTYSSIRAVFPARRGPASRSWFARTS